MVVMSPKQYAGCLCILKLEKSYKLYIGKFCGYYVHCTVYTLYTTYTIHIYIIYSNNFPKKLTSHGKMLMTFRTTKFLFCLSL